MLYLLAIVLPPVAVLLSGKPIEALLNVVLTLFFWVPGMIHALFIVNSHHADQRADRMIRAIKREGEASVAAGQSALAVETGRRVVGRDGRVACPSCGYRNTRSRHICKECRADLDG